MEKKVIQAIVFVVGVILISLLIVKPLIQGFSVIDDDGVVDKCEGKLKNLDDRYDVITGSLGTCKELNQELIDRMEAANIKQATCTLTVEACEREDEELSETITKLQTEVSNTKIEISSLETSSTSQMKNLTERYSLLAQNTANNLCCKAKIDNENIGYYTVKNDKIVCLESGTQVIVC
tara:strand:- start:4328 stop:4864 length:537 start_codon:yes stop_codon:yes gene_type:complete